MAVLSMRRPAAAAPLPPSGVRLRLAERIEAITAAKARIAAVEQAFQRTYRAVTEARDRHVTATAAIETALRAASDHAVALVLNPGTAGPPPQSVTAARAAAQEAEDNLRTAEQTRDTLQAEGAKLPGEMPLLEMLRDDAARAVMLEEAGPAIAALFARIEAAHREAVDAGLALNTLINTRVIADQGPDAYPHALEYSSRINFNSWSIASLPNASPTAAAWRAAWEALKADAMAPVPVVP